MVANQILTRKDLVEGRTGVLPPTGADSLNQCDAECA